MENQILLCLEWLDLQKITKTINVKHTSLEYQHMIEEWAGVYISEDAFIEAIHIRAIPYKHVPFQLETIYVGLSEKTIRLYRERIMSTRYGQYRRIEPLKRETI